GALVRVATASVGATAFHGREQEAPPWAEPSSSFPLVRSVIARGTPSVISCSEAPAEVEGVSGTHEPLLEALGLQSCFCVPLLAHQRRPFGALSLGSRDDARPFGA